jgi:hypothetical protein
LGSFHPSFELEPNVKEAVAQKRLSEVSERYGLELEDIDVEFDSSMPYNVMGRTSVSGYSSNQPEITVGDSFLEASEPEQLKTMLHEGIHVKQFQGEVDNWLRDEFNASRDFVREVEKSSDPRYTEEIEGITEALTDTILPFDVGTGYPYEKRSKMSELESKGFDIESELVEDIEGEFNGLVEDYKQIYESFDLGGAYLEQGEFNGVEYTALAIGYEDGEAAVNEYLAESFDEDYSEMLEPDSATEGYLA